MKQKFFEATYNKNNIQTIFKMKRVFALKRAINNSL